MNTTDALAKVRAALCDPDAPWYGSDLVPLVADVLDTMELERDTIDADRRRCEQLYAELMRQRDRAVEALREIATSHSVMEPPHARADRALRDITGASE